jgi:putative ABC transport system permease protein
MMDDGDNAALVFGSRTTPGLLDLLGVPPQLGRTLSASDGVVGAEHVVVISHGFWQNRLGGDPDVIGSTVRFTETPYTIVGVMPQGFQFRGSFFVPFQWDLSNLGFRRSNFINLYGRLAPGANGEAASAELHSLWTGLGAQQAEDLYDDSGMRAEPLLEATVSRSRTPLFILAGAVGLVLLVACANVANLMLARSEARHREIALRAALGAGRGRLIRQFLTESLVLSVGGGLVGLGAAFAGMRVLLALSANAIPRVDEIGMNGIVLAFALLVSVVTGIVVGLAPALQAKADHAALKDGARGTSGKMTLLRQGLVVTEVALALMLVTGTGLLLKSFWNAQGAEMGFDSENLLIVNLWLPPSRYENAGAQTIFFETLLPQLRGLPQVRQAGMTNMVPVESFGNNFTTISPVGDDERQSHFVEARRITETYFETMGIPLQRGRNFDPSDLTNSGATVVVNEELVRQLFDDDQNPVGARLGGDLRSHPEIIGVVGNVRGYRPDEHPRPTIYFAVPVSSNLMIRTASDPEQATGQIRQAVAGLDPAVRVYDVDVMSEIVDDSLGDRKFQLILLLVFAGVALTLGAVGIYGVMSYSVAQQTRELGVRMALGALPGDVLKLVVGKGAILAVIGVVIGGTATFLLRRVLEGVLFDVSATDPITYGSVALLLIGVAVVACFVPARRAASVDPMEALRYE